MAVLQYKVRRILRAYYSLDYIINLIIAVIMV